MTRRARRLGAALVAVGALAAVPPTSASLSATVAPGSEVGVRALLPPTGLAGEAAGHDVALSWLARSGEEFQLEGGAGTCATASMSPLATTSSGTYLHPSTHLPEGSTWCYRVQTALPGSQWTSLGTPPTVPVRIGVVVTAVTLANGAATTGCPAGFQGRAGSIDCGDTITIDFNQPIDTATGGTTAHKVCVGAPVDVIFIATTTARGDCSDPGTVHVGRLVGGTVAQNDGYAMTPTWSDGGRRLTVRLGDHTRASAYPVAPGPWTFEPTTHAPSLLSATGAQHVCTTNTGGGACTVAVTGSF